MKRRLAIGILLSFSLLFGTAGSAYAYCTTFYGEYGLPDYTAAPDGAVVEDYFYTDGWLDKRIEYKDLFNGLPIYTETLYYSSDPISKTYDGSGNLVREYIAGSAGTSDDKIHLYRDTITGEPAPLRIAYVDEDWNRTRETDAGGNLTREYIYDGSLKEIRSYENGVLHSISTATFYGCVFTLNTVLVNPSPAPSPAPTDTQKPTTRMITPFVSTRISKTTTFKVKWSATDAAPSSGIKHYTVRYRPSTSSTWRTYKANTTAKEALFKGKAGVTYYFRTTATDNAGNTGTSKVYKTIVPFNEGNSLLRRIGFNGYQKLGKSQNYLTSVRYSYERGHTLIYKLYKTDGIGLVVTKGPKMGRAKIYVDGKYVGIVDAKSSKTRARQLIFYRNLKKKGTHYLKVVNLGTPGRARFEVDAVVVKR